MLPKDMGMAELAQIVERLQTKFTDAIKDARKFRGEFTA
jgi:hypothetical protein